MQEIAEWLEKLGSAAFALGWGQVHRHSGDGFRNAPAAISGAARASLLGAFDPLEAPGGLGRPARE
jgi:hypothetical protein